MPFFSNVISYLSRNASSPLQSQYETTRNMTTKLTSYWQNELVDSTLIGSVVYGPRWLLPILRPSHTKARSRHTAILQVVLHCDCNGDESILDILHPMRIIRITGTMVKMMIAWELLPVVSSLLLIGRSSNTPNLQCVWRFGHSSKTNHKIVSKTFAIWFLWKVWM